MRVTIIADASFCPDTKVAGYGFWIASERGKQGGDGAMRGQCANNIVAEMQAVANALHQGLKLGLIQHSDFVLIQTDCEPAIQAFDGTRTKLIEQEEECCNLLTTLQTRFGLAFEFRHVKGHSGNTEARFAANNRCDKAARKAMRKARDLHRIQGLKELLA